MPTWYWIVTAILCFNASVVFAASVAYDREWPSKLLFSIAMVTGAWGIALAGFGALFWLVS